ncbi:hypothetical protein KM043_016518 [Ampulex compressa]|nr:hypothetical protein KM043_016518 [Ampulex compressa]
MAFQHQAGTAMECLSIPITLHKETEVDENGEEVMKCGFKIGGGIDQDFRKSPQGYTDKGIYVTEVHEGSPAAKSGLRMHDKILQCNGLRKHTNEASFASHFLQFAKLMAIMTKNLLRGNIYLTSKISNTGTSRADLHF